MQASSKQPATWSRVYQARVERKISNSPLARSFWLIRNKENGIKRIRKREDRVYTGLVRCTMLCARGVVLCTRNKRGTVYAERRRSGGREEKYVREKYVRARNMNMYG